MKPVQYLHGFGSFFGCVFPAEILLLNLEMLERERERRPKSCRNQVDGNRGGVNQEIATKNLQVLVPFKLLCRSVQCVCLISIHDIQFKLLKKILYV